MIGFLDMADDEPRERLEFTFEARMDDQSRVSAQELIDRIPSEQLLSMAEMDELEKGDE